MDDHSSTRALSFFSKVMLFSISVMHVYLGLHASVQAEHWSSNDVFVYAAHHAMHLDADG